jgi:tetratricopeptide (TPR) repeat protein
MNVANALEAEFSLEEQASIEKIPTDSPAAYALYLRAVATLQSASGEEFERFGWSDDLDRAVVLDPRFALAHATKALQYAYFPQSPDETGGRVEPWEQIALAAAETALSIDPTLGLAHTALAVLHSNEWRWADAQIAYDSAYQVSPNDLRVRIEYARFHRIIGAYDEAVRLSRRTVELDPNTFNAHYQLGVSLRYSRDLEAARAEFRRAAELAPASATAHAQIGYVDVALGNPVEAAREIELAEEIWGESLTNFRIGQLALGYAQLDRDQDVERLFAELENMASVEPVTAPAWALVYLALGDEEQAFRWIERAVINQEPNVTALGQIKANTFDLATLNKPRFQALRDRIGALE